MHTAKHCLNKTHIRESIWIEVEHSTEVLLEMFQITLLAVQVLTQLNTKGYDRSTCMLCSDHRCEGMQCEGGQCEGVQ